MTLVSFFLTVILGAVALCVVVLAAAFITILFKELIKHLRKN
jgi:hypothetical protein